MVDAIGAALGLLAAPRLRTRQVGFWISITLPPFGGAIIARALPCSVLRRALILQSGNFLTFTRRGLLGLAQLLLGVCFPLLVDALTP